MIKIKLNDSLYDAQVGERLIDVIQRAAIEVPAVCYHAQLGPLQTCDTCMVEVQGRLVRACATVVDVGMNVQTASAAASAAQREAFDRVLSNHLLHCTVCDNNNGNCTVHNTTKMLAVEHQHIPFKTKPYAVDDSNPFYQYDPANACCAGAVSKHVRTSKSTKRCRSIGTMSTHAFCGTAARRSENPAASPAVTASLSVPAMH